MVLGGSSANATGVLTVHVSSGDQSIKSGGDPQWERRVNAEAVLSHPGETEGTV
jgi:hypothetical protein